MKKFIESSESKINEEFFFLDTEFDANDVKEFAEWCLCNEKFKFDTQGKFWYDSKLQKKSWDEMLKIYFEEHNEDK